MPFLDELDNLHESQRLEFKDASGGLPNDLWETYSAMANTEGGEIVLGVHEDKATRTFSIVGVADPQWIISTFWSNVRDRSRVERDVMLSDGVRTQAVQGKELVIIEVPKADRGDKPVRVYDKKAKAFVAWVRKHEGDFRASDDDLRLMSYDNVPGADRRPIETLGVDALCDKTIQRYRNVFSGRMPQSPWNSDSTEDFLYHIGALAKTRSGALCPTRAGLISFGHEYEITGQLPNYLLDYREETSGGARWDDRIVSQSGDWSGNAIDFYFETCGRLLRHFKSPFTSDSSGTVHGVGNPVTEALNEVVANTLIHADYGTSSGGGIRIVLGRDGIAARNPGTFLIERDVAIAGGFSEPRNPTLMRIFSFIGACDRAGSGLEMVYRTWESTFGKTPALLEEHGPSAVTLSLPMADAALSTSKSVRGRNGALNRKELLELVATRVDGVTAQEAQRLTGASERVIQKALRDFFQHGLVDRTRQGHSWVYTVKAN